MKKIINHKRKISLLIGFAAITALVIAYFLFSQMSIFESKFIEYGKFLLVLVGIVFALSLNPLMGMLLKSEEKIIDEMTEKINITDEQIEQEYRTADRSGTLLINNNCIFINHIMSIKIIPMYDIVWVFKKQSIKKSSRRLQYSMVIKTKKKKTYEIPFAKKERLDDFIEKYSIFPHIILGYDKKIEGLYQHRIEDFLELQYVQNEPIK